MKTIIFYAPLGTRIPIEKIGGAEAGCLKTKQIYETAGIRVIILDKPAMSRGKVDFMVKMACTPFKLVSLLHKYPHAVLHIVGFYTKNAWFERFLMNVGKRLGHRVIYELRNGSMVRTYQEGTASYKKILKDLLLKPDIVLCQGMEYVDFIRQQWSVERSYYPNYIMDDFLEVNNLDRPYPLRLIYFGRVTESKNVDVIIKVLSIIRNNGIDAKLDIIGGYSEAYKSLLDEVVKKENVAESVTFYGRRPFDFIAAQLRRSHYFVFPSQEKQEGHSNSLTEAMGCGVVPIVSRAGFNASICGKEELVISSLNAQQYADKIIEIEEKKGWARLSQEVYTRVVKNFTQSIVSEKLLGYIDRLFY